MDIGIYLSSETIDGDTKFYNLINLAQSEDYFNNLKALVFPSRYVKIIIINKKLQLGQNLPQIILKNLKLKEYQSIVNSYVPLIILGIFSILILVCVILVIYFNFKKNKIRKLQDKRLE